MIITLSRGRTIDLDFSYDTRFDILRIHINAADPMVRVMVTTSEDLEDWLTDNREAQEQNGGEDVEYIDSTIICATYLRPTMPDGTQIRDQRDMPAICHIITDAYSAQVTSSVALGPVPASVALNKE